MAGLPLPKPQTQGGRPLLQALNDRKTTRNISQEKLSPQMLSNLLWAAWGVNRPANNGRTAPSAMNVQEISVYVFLEQSVYLFDEKAHGLKPVVVGDHRAKAGTQTGVAKAPVSLLYVADLDKYRAGLPAESKVAWSNAHAGFIGQNVYLFAASEGLASWFRAFVDAPAAAQLLSLRPGQKVLYGQTVGYPAKG
jgi:nitroreductase